MLKKLYVILIGAMAIILAACATTQYYANAVNSWNGAPTEAVYRTWGYPNYVTTLPNGHKVLVYAENYNQQQPIYSTPGSTTVVQNPNGTTNVYSTTPTVSGGGIYNYQCTTWFELGKNNRVVNTSFRGNNCVATQQFMMTHSYQGY